MRAAIFMLALVSFLAAACGENAGSGQTRSDSSSAPSSSELRTIAIESSGGAEVEVRAEIADGLLERYAGLRGRERLAERRGMLFVFSNEEQRSFTMEDTLIPLSIAFMDSRGRIVDIQDMKPRTQGPYSSAKPAQYALEVNRGFFEERGVEVGNQAKLPE